MNRMSYAIKEIIKETGATNVKRFYFDKVKKEWVITFKNGIKEIRFNSFLWAYDFLKEEGED